MEKEITIKVKITEGFANDVLCGRLNREVSGTFDEKVDRVISRFMTPLYRAMANYAIKEQKELALAQVRQAEEEALSQAQTLVEITKDETTNI